MNAKLPAWMIIPSLAMNLIFGFYIAKKVWYLYSSNIPSGKLPHNVYDAYEKSKITTGDIVFIGDSETEGFPISEMFNNPRLKNRGIRGDKSNGVLNRLDTLIKPHPNKVFICIGINDLLANIPVDTVMGNIEKSLIKIKSESPQTVIYVQSVLPSTWKKLDGSDFVLNDIVKLNDKIKRLCDTSNIQYIDLYSNFLSGAGMDYKYDSGDHLHVNYNGYVQWGSLIKEYVK